MTWHDPSALQLLLLTGLAYRLWRLIGWDTITAPLRRWATGFDDDGTELTGTHGSQPVRWPWPWSRPRQVWEWDRGAPLSWRYLHDGRMDHTVTDVPAPPAPRERLATFIHCPWCLGFWTTIAVAGWWWASPDSCTVAAVVATMSAAVGLVGGNVDHNE